MTIPTRALPPSLTDYTERGKGDATHIALTFDAPMAAGRGAVYITDGALQDVIDRATGAPALQVVGATDTHRIAASDIVIAGNVVTLDVAGLLPGHTYSLVMDGGVLVSDVQAAFAGVRSSSQLQFTTAPAAALPQVDHVSTSGSVLSGGGTIALTLTFTEAVPNLPLAALHAPHATVTGLYTDDGGITWHATLKAPAGAVTEPVNTFSLDMTQVMDAAGHHGSGSDALFTYRVDTRAPAIAALNLDGASLTAGHGIVATLTFSEAVTGVAAALSAGHAGVSDVHSLDGGVTWLATLTGAAATTAQGDMLALDLARVYDLAGNAGSGLRMSSAYTVDTQAPQALAIAFDGTLLAGGNGVTVTFTFSEAIRDLPAAAIDTPHAALSGLHSSDGGLTWRGQLTATDQGSWNGNTIAVDLAQLHDLAGNAGSGGFAGATPYDIASAPPTASVDRIGLLVDGASATPAETNDSHAWYGGTLTQPLHAGQSVEVTIDGQAAGTAVIGDDPTAWSFRQEALLDDGPHTVGARVVDADGHATGTASLAYTVDTTAPQIGSANVGADFDPGSAIVVTFSEAVYWSGANGNSLLLATPGGATRPLALGEDAFSNGHRTLTIAAADLALAPGSDYTLLFNGALHDRAGNAVGSPGIDIHTAGSADTTPPTAYDAVPVEDGGTYRVGDSVEFTVHFSEPVYVAGSAPVVALNNGGYAELDRIGEDRMEAVFRYTVTAGSRATNRLDVANSSDLAGHFADVAGNLLDGAHVRYTHLDNSGGDIVIAPLTAPAIAPGSDSGIKGDGITSDDAPVLTGGGALPGAQIYILVANTYAGATRADAQGNWTWHMDAQPPGTYSVNVDQLDGPRIVGISPTLALTLIAAPDLHAALTADSDSGTPGDGITSTARPIFTGRAEAGTTITVFDGGVKLGQAVAGASGSWTFAAPADLADGAHAITLAALDNLGRFTPASASQPLHLTIDTHAPDAPGRPVLDPGSDSGTSHDDGITNDTTPTLNGSVAASRIDLDGIVEIYDGAVLLGSAPVDDGGPWTFTVPDGAALSDGEHVFTVRQVDAAGNRSAASVPLAVTIDTRAPTVAARNAFVKDGQHWIDLAFGEPVVFARGGVLDALDATNRQQAHYTADVRTNWTVAADVLSLKLGTPDGALHLAMGGDAIQDLAGNVALIGTYTLSAGIP